MARDDWDDEDDGREERPRRRRHRVVYEAPKPASRAAFGLGLAALLLGVLALPLYFVPAVGKFSVILAGGGFLLGLAGLLLAAVQGEGGLAIPLAGTVVGVAALGVGAAQLLGYLGGKVHEAETALTKGLEGSPEALNTLLGGQKAVEAAPEKEPPQPDLPWHDASKGPLQLGDARVQVGYVIVSPVRLQGVVERSETPESYVGVQVFIQNVSQTRKIDYPGWSRSSSAQLRLTDNFGNVYKRYDPGLLDTIIGQVREPTSIHPGERLEDLLVFERPLPNVQALRLELPAAAVGGSGSFRFLIPRSMIRR
jgi:hypothetical protein